MKVIGMTDNHAGEVKVQLGSWGGPRYFRFTETPPPKNALVCLTLDGLDFTPSDNWWDDKLGRSVAAWLKQRGRDGFTASDWTAATLDDWLESANAEVWQHSLGQLFTLDDAVAFWQAHESRLVDALRAAVRARDDAERARLLQTYEKTLRRLSMAGAAIHPMLQVAQIKLQARLDRARVKAAREKARSERGESRLTPTEWVLLFEKLKDRDTLQKVAHWAGDDLVARSANQDDLLEGLKTLGRSKRLREIVGYDERFWKKFHGKLALKPTETDATIDITEAREQPVMMSFELLRARRVGPVMPGRTALVVLDDKGQPEVYIRGERKLKLAAQRASGGTVRKFGCTLVFTQDKKLENFLLDIERLDTLAQLNPLAALPDDADEALRALADAARTDWKQARVLADLLIEKQTGVDASILRRHSRSRVRSGRR